MVVFSAGDTAWVLICSLLVLLMSIPAVAFFYGGLSKRKNVLNTIFLTFIAFSIVSVIWVIFGYQFAFGADINGLIGAPTNFFLQGIGLDDLSGSIPTLLFVMFQCAFAGLTVALISGALVGRMKTKAWIIFTILWICAVYIPVAHWVWGGGWLAQMGALDFAGGAVVHMNSGAAALAVAIVLGKRKDTSLIPHNLGYAVLGAALLWFGWMGFNGGSGLAADGLAANAIIVSNVAAATALIVWTVLDTFIVGKPTVLLVFVHKFIFGATNNTSQRGGPNGSFGPPLPLYFTFPASWIRSQRLSRFSVKSSAPVLEPVFTSSQRVWMKAFRTPSGSSRMAWEMARRVFILCSDSSSRVSPPASSGRAKRASKKTCLSGRARPASHSVTVRSMKRLAVSCSSARIR